jgi:solute carrier family 35 protein E1
MLKQCLVKPSDIPCRSMSTTTVTGTGRRLSMRQSNRQPPIKMSNPQQMNSPLDKFPPFIDDAPDSAIEAVMPRSAQQLRNNRDGLWQPRKAGHVSWEHMDGLGISKHRSRKSISEAINTIRTRNASMSANAHELAEALRAPVSYRLIVRLTLCDGLEPRNSFRT